MEEFKTAVNCTPPVKITARIDTEFSIIKITTKTEVPNKKQGGWGKYTRFFT